jgi:hypothetical protein
MSEPIDDLVRAIEIGRRIHGSWRGETQTTPTAAEVHVAAECRLQDIITIFADRLRS